MSSNQARNHHQTGVVRRSKSKTRAETRHHHQTSDPTLHYTFQQLRQRAAEWNQPLWVAVIRFRKGVSIQSSSASYGCLARARHCGALQKDGHKSVPQTEKQQTAHTDVESMHLHHQRGAKQEDPLSTLLFSSLLQHITNQLSEKSNRDNHGVRLAEHDSDANLSNLKFADDIHLISSSLTQKHDHYAWCVHHNHNSAWPTTNPHENKNISKNTSNHREQHCNKG